MCCAHCHIWPIKVIITCYMQQIVTHSLYTHILTWVNSKVSSTKLDWKNNIFKHCLLWPRTEITETFNISNNNTWTKAIVDCKLQTDYMPEKQIIFCNIFVFQCILEREAEEGGITCDISHEPDLISECQCTCQPSYPHPKFLYISGIYF